MERNKFMKRAASMLMVGSLFFMSPTVEKIDQTNHVSASTNKIEATPMNLNYYFEGELVPSSNKEGMYKYGGKYLPSAIQYENAVYVPIEFLTKQQNYSLIYDGGDIWLTSPTNEFNIGEDIPELPMGHYESPNYDDEEIEFEEEYVEENAKYGVNIGDLEFFNISPYEDADDAINMLKFKNKKVLNTENDVFITDSLGTNTSIFMSIEKNNNNEVTGIDYEDFSAKFKKINQKYKYDQPSFKSTKGITVGSKMLDVLEKHGENPIVNIGEVDPETDKTGSKTESKLVKAFDPYLNDSEINVEMRQKNIPKNSPQNELLYLTITYEFDGFNSGYLTYYAVVSKKESITNASIYGFNYKLY